MRIVFPPTFFNRRNALTARGASKRIRITAVGSKEHIDMVVMGPEVGLRLRLVNLAEAAKKRTSKFLKDSL